MRRASLLLLAGSTLASGAQSSVSVRGLTPELAEKVRNGGEATTFGCDGGARVLSLSHLNDDFCDCLDGADEPGT
jgi:protein kinase C substrate 80K-H